jgi:hypothetical protein
MIRSKYFGIALTLLLAAPSGLAAGHEHEHGAGEAVTVYKSRTCGCCNKWVDHMRKHGFKVTTHDTEDMASIKASLGVPATLESCHTAVIGKYVIEGHVPASDIDRLLKRKPKIGGLAVPGMPSGSPGMENGRKDAFDVIAFTAGRKSSVFAKH